MIKCIIYDLIDIDSVTFYTSATFFLFAIHLKLNKFVPLPFFLFTELGLRPSVRLFFRNSVKQNRSTEYPLTYIQ